MAPRSTERFLTTHTGSLPRPLGLTRLYARRARGEPVDAAELQAAGRAAMNAIVAKQVEAGIDVGNNGEQQRDSFIFYIRDRLTGLGGSWQRRQRADVERYPIFMKESYEASLKKESVDDIRGLPKAIGDVGYPDATEMKTECADFRAALDAAGNPFVEPFLWIDGRLLTWADVERRVRLVDGYLPIPCVEWEIAGMRPV